MTWLFFLALSYSYWIPTAPPVGGEMRAARERFTSAVTNGRLKGFNDLRCQVAFKPARRVASEHRPGPMEDDVIASTLRGCIVADPALSSLGLQVSSRAGKVTLNGSPPDPGALARLIVLALGLDGVTRVRADLPAGLRVKS